jgi:flagellar biosynthesis protein FlhB
MESSSQDRNLPASQRKLNKAKDDGQVARSRDLSHLAVLGGGAVAVMVLAPVLFDQLKLGLSQQLSFDSKSILQTGSMLGRLHDMTLTGLIGCGVFAAIVMAASILSAIGSGGWVASLKPVMPDFSRLNPISGFSRMFTKEKFSEVAKMTFVMAVLILLGAMYFSTNLQAIASLTLQPSQAAIQALNEWLKKGMGVLLLVIFVVAVIDVQLQNFLHKSRLKMSHQEVKQEQKESEGSPQLKGRLRQRQREISHGNSISAVVRADFVVMNPTHFAVAIRYDEKTMRAPQVISKGADLLAMKIRDIAKTNSIPVLQSPILARALYANAELDQDIPSSLYTAVAQVLAYVYRLKSALRGDGPMPGEQPDPFVPPELDPLFSQVSNQNQP